MVKVALALAGWQFSMMLVSPQKPNPALKLPTEAEIKAMIKESYRRFREAIKKQRGRY